MFGTSMSEWISGTSKVLVAGQRVEIGKFFELLLSHPGRQFVHAKDPSHCFDLALKKLPSLIIIDCAMAGLCQCYELVIALKGSTRTTGTPILLVIDSQKEGEDLGGLQAEVDGVLYEPFSPTRIITLVETFL